MINIRQLPFPRHFGIKHIKEVELWADLCLEQWIVPKGTMIKTWTSLNFGWCFVPPGTKDKRGFEMPKHIFRW